MKASQRNQLAAAKKAERAQSKPPKISKYAAKRRGPYVAPVVA